MMGTVRARVRGIVRDAGRTVVQAVDDAGREYAVEVPEDIAATPSCSTCGPTCGCAPCRLRHGDGAREHDHDHDHDHDEALVLVLAWSLHTLPGVAPSPPPTTRAVLVSSAPTPEPAAAAARPLEPAEVDAAFMALMECLAAPPSTAEPSAPRATSSATDPLDELLGFLPGPRL